ncbi:MAG: flagellar biosynthetic protein FliQ [Sphingobium sp.]|nr:flagellar biosynthetic protein FliQ [Sphingobium sp.]
MTGLSPADVMAIARAAIMLVLTIAGPMLLTSLILGVVIGLFQSLTQIQEMTLTFVPKLLGISLVMLMCMPMIGRAMESFMTEISTRIIGG